MFSTISVYRKSINEKLLKHSLISKAKLDTLSGSNRNGPLQSKSKTTKFL